jgi:hypothetical protein
MASRGGTAARGGGPAATAPRRAASAADARANYQRRLEDLVGRAADAFRVRFARDCAQSRTCFPMSWILSHF